MKDQLLGNKLKNYKEENILNLRASLVVAFSHTSIVPHVPQAGSLVGPV